MDASETEELKSDSELEKLAAAATVQVEPTMELGISDASASSHAPPGNL